MLGKFCRKLVIPYFISITSTSHFNSKVLQFALLNKPKPLNSPRRSANNRAMQDFVSPPF